MEVKGGSHTITAAEASAGRANINVGLANIASHIVQVRAAANNQHKTVGSFWFQSDLTTHTGATTKQSAIAIIDGTDSLATDDIVEWGAVSG